MFKSLLLCVFLVPCIGFSEDISFQTFVHTLKQQAQQEHINEATISTVFANIKQLKKVTRKFKSQPEFHLSWPQYQKIYLTSRRVKNAKYYLKKYHNLLQRVQKHYHVPATLIVSLWGLETNYGQDQGVFPVFSALATMAYTEKRRCQYFTQQFIIGLMLLQSKRIDWHNMQHGSWAGAMGQCQFLPVRYARYAQTLSGGNKADIWHSTNDTFSSTANFLYKNHWERHFAAAIAIYKPANLKASSHSVHTMQFYKQHNVKRINGVPLPHWRGQVAIISIDHGRYYFLVNNNFKVLLKWNDSYFYALAVNCFNNLLSTGTIR